MKNRTVRLRLDLIDFGRIRDNLSSFKKLEVELGTISNLAQQQDGFIKFVLEKTGLDDRQWPTVHFNETMSTFAVCNSRGGFLNIKSVPLVYT